MRVLTIARHASKARQRVFGMRLDHGRVTDQRDTFQLAKTIARSVKGTAIVGTEQAVVADQTRHEDRVNRAGGEELQNLALVGAAKFSDRGRFTGLRDIA